MTLALLCPPDLSTDLFTLLFLLIRAMGAVVMPVVVATGFITALVKLVKELSAKR